jgi:hypothetical protein
MVTRKALLCLPNGERLHYGVWVFQKVRRVVNIFCCMMDGQEVLKKQFFFTVASRNK